MLIGVHLNTYFSNRARNWSGFFAAKVCSNTKEICIIDIVFVGGRENGQISQVVHLAAPTLFSEWPSGPLPF